MIHKESLIPDYPFPFGNPDAGGREISANKFFVFVDTENRISYNVYVNTNYKKGLRIMKYKNEYLKEISFPIGGIGTGSIGLAGNGRLIDWEIFNRPSKGSMNGYSHIAVKAKTKSGNIHAKVLNGDLQKDLVGQYSKLKFSGYGFGPSSATMCGFPHFESCEFIGEFPVAQINFKDKNFPADVSLTAFNPFIPLDDKNSSIPAAFYEISFTNTEDEAVEYTTAFSVMNPFEISKNVTVQNDQYSMIKMLFDEIDVNETKYGDLTLVCDSKNAVVQNYWYRGGWQDGVATFWREFSSENDLKERNYDENGKICVLLLRRLTLNPMRRKRFALFCPGTYQIITTIGIL